MHNVEQYTLSYLNQYWDMYVNLIKENGGKDIDYPNLKLNFK